MENKHELKHRIRVAMHQEPADIVFTHGKIVVTFTEEVIEADVAIAKGKVVAIGNVPKAHETVDLKGAYLCPALIDSHIHVESSMMTPEGLAEAVVPHGTGATISDPHEIVNVLGIKGLEYMVKAADGLPLDIFFTIPSCVPATHMETSGGVLKAKDIRRAYQVTGNTPALSEMMNYPGVYFGDDEVLEKICIAHELGLEIDGHAPMLGGKELNAYMNARIVSDHECCNTQEALDKLRRGMYVLIREGSAARNLRDLIPVLTDKTAHRICIASDDTDPAELHAQGHLDHTWRKMMDLGVDPLRALRVLTLNPATLYRLHDRGGLGIGYRADFFTVTDLRQPVVHSVYHDGVLVAKEGKLLAPLERKESKNVLFTVHVPNDLKEKLQNFPKTGAVKVIGIKEGQLITDSLTADAQDVTNPDKDICYLAVVERHGKNGNVGLGFIKGLGLKSGALASTVAHDHHNLILAGKNLEEMEVAARATRKMGGGFVVVQNKQVKASVPLPVGGIMSLKAAGEVAHELEAVEAAAKNLGITCRAPFMVLSFMALSVIPHLKLTDKGMVDVDKFALVSLTQ